MSYSAKKTGSKLGEMMMIVIILGLAAMSTVPQLSLGAPQENTAPVDADQISLQDAVYQYFADHRSTYPTAISASQDPANSSNTFAQQLTMRSNAKGNTSESKSYDFPFGPYLHNGIPVQRQVGNNHVTVLSQRTPLTATPTIDTGWLYNSFTGQIIANTPQN